MSLNRSSKEQPTRRPARKHVGELPDTVERAVLDALEDGI